jgi:hypothetical protein
MSRTYTPWSEATEDRRTVEMDQDREAVEMDQDREAVEMDDARDTQPYRRSGAASARSARAGAATAHYRRTGEATGRYTRAGAAIGRAADVKPPAANDSLEDYEYFEPDRQWVWVATVAAAILLVAVIATIAVVNGGDSATVSGTVVPKPTTSKPATTPTPSAAPSAKPAPSATADAPTASSLPETITTVSPPPPQPSPTPAQVTATPEQAAPPPVVDPRTVVYTVSGTTQLLDLVTVIYTDEQGALQTDVNVALPWTKTVVRNPGVELSSVTATSITGHLNCRITNATGETIAAQTNNTIISTCTH